MPSMTLKTQLQWRLGGDKRTGIWDDCGALQGSFLVWPPDVGPGRLPHHVEPPDWSRCRFPDCHHSSYRDCLCWWRVGRRASAQAPDTGALAVPSFRDSSSLWQSLPKLSLFRLKAALPSPGIPSKSLPIPVGVRITALIPQSGGAPQTAISAQSLLP